MLQRPLRDKTRQHRLELVALIAFGCAVALFAALAPFCSFAADLPKKAAVAAPAPAPVLSTSPFYIGLLGGAGFSSTESDITILGTAQGPLKAYPTGLLAGGEFGARWNTGTFTIGLNVAALYDFSRASVDAGLLMPGVEAASMKNGFLLMEGGSFGINLSTLMGYVPTAAQPSHWAVPITVPTNLAGNLSVNAIGGLAQRWVTLCAAVPDITSPTGVGNDCASKIINGPYLGGELTGMLSTNWEAKFRVAHIFWNSSFTPTTSVSPTIFQNTVNAKDETIGLAGLTYHF
jgi:hypothetical protein